MSTGRSEDVETAFVAVGSNLGDRLRLLRSAAADLDRAPGVAVEACSSIWITAPVLPAHLAGHSQPHQGEFYNGVLRLRTTRSAPDLLELLLEIERRHGRRRAESASSGPPRPRTLDLDLLLFGELTTSGPRLTVPHPRLGERHFVLEPLCELVPDLVVPGRGASVRDLLAALRRRDVDPAPPGASRPGRLKVPPEQWCPPGPARSPKT
ncbi:MAG: 2-amino-4-hydroxy-6-hydroxymethyldihydropteridine diphosphokinase [Acidobacteria bacterium]|nr:MAG: 2-amino-4-hydroxy-6-hydroxymethyldihydropteridine diphosphokinase [Acidobacteriota bacterium]REJ99400.1 MAG: 2-amino-4-hydroxy-6-hydroxymethyldihydropteridine diphosphokinase [Acidobacteriota bacterium]